MDVPLVVFVNTKSGGLQGTKLIEKFKKCIPPENVYDLSRDGPLLGLQKYGGRRRFRVVVCGGDGSVGWVLTEIEKLKLPKELTPPVAILPIGTGNDLSRVLKWGGSHKGTKLKSFIGKIEKACVVLLDKWELKYTTDVPMPRDHPHFMHNYFSIGADASIALQFHEMRLAHPEKFSSRTQNLAWYVRLGLQNFSSELLAPHVSVEINGCKMEMPESTRCVVVLNLPSYSGGGNPWGTKRSRRHSYANPAVDDGLLEVVAVNGPLQLVGIHAKVIRGKRLGQGNHVKITMTKALAAQVDGEPWNQPPSVIEINLAGKSHMLANSLPTPLPASGIPNSTDSPVAANTLFRQPSVYGLNRTMSRNLVRTRSSSAPIVHTPSPIKYGPIAPSKRKKGRMYCDGCGLEFYLPYMLSNHINSGLCTNGATSSRSAAVKLSSTPPIQKLSVQLGDGASTTDATSSRDCSDDEGGGIWRTQSAEVASRIHKLSTTEQPWTSAVEQAPITPATTPRPAEINPEHFPAPAATESEPSHKPTNESTHPHEPASEPHQPIHEPANEPVQHPTTNEEVRVQASGSPSDSQNFPRTHEKEGAEEQAERTSE